MTRIGIMQRLRGETRDCHVQLETRLGLPAAISTRSEYRDLLARFFGFYLPVEERLTTLLCGEHERREILSGLDYGARRKTDLLRRDLQALGMGDTELATLPQCDKLPALDTLSHALGCLYVLEGSTLGGQLLARFFADTLSIDASNGGAFFCSYGSEIGARWRAFGAVLTSWADVTQDGEPVTTNSVKQKQGEVIVHAARETFHSMETWLCSGG